MGLFQWKPEFEIHISRIDDQHRGLVSIINDLYAAKQDGETGQAIILTIDRLIEYVNVHFRDEEAAMQEWGYPEIGNHRLQHEELESRVYDLRATIKSGRDVATFELLNFLSEWFKVHICESDKQFGLYVEEQQAQNSVSEI